MAQTKVYKILPVGLRRNWVLSSALEKSVLLIVFLALTVNSNAQEILYTMPEETELHEGTWIQWPHNNLYGPSYKWEVSSTFVDMTAALEWGENVHIVAYDSTEMNQIINRLNNAEVPLDNIDFFIFETDDVWIRDNGPIFVFDSNDDLSLLDWGFNGWGNDAPFEKCDLIPESIGSAITVESIDLNSLVLEGGAIEHDGNGTMMATRSSVTHPSRNPDLSESEIEDYLTTYMGFTNFIWLDGLYGSDITDMHIDGFVKFAGNNTIVTMDSIDLDYWYVADWEMEAIYGANNYEGESFEIVTLPLTQNNVVTSYGLDLGYKGSYVNYYIANEVVLVPSYNDPNDNIALNILATVHADREVIGIDVRNIYAYGGMIHCLTQQQPASAQPLHASDLIKENMRAEVYPNPFSNQINIDLSEYPHEGLSVMVHTLRGERVLEKELKANTDFSKIDVSSLNAGMYILKIEQSGNVVHHVKMVKME